MADTTLYKQIVLEWGQDTDSLIWGMGYSPDNGEHFYVLNTTYGRKYRTEDGDRIWPFIVDKVKAVLDWSNITNKPDLALKTDLTWTNITNRPDVDKIASQASQAVVTANTAQSQASAAGQAASSASAQASAAKASADTATATANAAKASASTASATAASAQQVANSASASASATAVALKSKADTATVNAQFTAVNSSVASAQSTADSAVAGLANKLDKTALTWGNIANKPTDLATSDSVAKAQSAANSAVSMASGATATANSAKSTATSAAGVANTANTTANSALTKANSAVSVANQANSNASSAVNTANQANTTANTANSNANQANSKITDMQTNGGGRNLAIGTASKKCDNPQWGADGGQISLDILKSLRGQWITISCDMSWTGFAKSDKAQNRIGYELGLHYSDGTYLYINNWYLPSDSEANKSFRFSRSWKLPDKELTSINEGWLYNQIIATTCVTSKLMIEKGTVAHDWSPAPEDVQTQIDANETAAANAQASANNAQNTANSAQSTANTAIKVSETLKDLGTYTATASGTTANSPTTGLPRTSGVSMTQVYNNGYPSSYGNVLNVAGNGTGQLLLGWSGNDNTTEHLWYRSHRDTSTGGWGTWQKIVYVSDLTWSNISGKPDVATKSDVSSALTVANTAKSTADSALSKANSNATALNNKANKSDLTWSNISGKPSIPSTFNGSITSTSTDFNSLVTEGHYDIRFSPSTQGKNGPKQGNWGLLDVKVAGRMIVQTYYSDQSNEVYVRNRYDGTWSGWRWVTFWPS